MEKAYKNVSILFGVILLTVVLGFYKTYFGLFPTFDKVTAIQHIHGTLFLVWFAMLIVQPVLIRKRQYKLHRAIGKFSYVLVPLIAISIVFIAKEAYLKGASNPDQSKVLAGLFTPFFQIVDFVTLYVLAIVNKRNMPAHMRYMITTSLAIMGAGLRRIFGHYFGMATAQEFIYAFLVIDLTLAGLIIYDVINKKKLKPYLISGAVIVGSQIAYYTLPHTGLWQTLCGGFVHLFFNGQVPAGAGCTI